ncbi:type II toxin-antitoxin system VapC family toxin [Algoriphagus hitonicola]|uniref:Predicted nucleic acid-binding protein, contains PIN domain n=1 Tax=Algoriphagus hitonicola TaxID=435880 RepID=A0A1I2T1W3_9BACT|nr:PIN domain-containing protein [Algoriphagus hitonicola]SFG59012.1 Predicted nucleic acid-binding protein, contains PIN domain [Algoriphagus hitonicola]
MKLFVDTSPFIYLVEFHKTYGEKVRDLLLTSVVRDDQLVTSVITWMEFSVIPKKTKRWDLIEKYQNLLDQLGIPLIEISKSTADQAAFLRSEYDFLRPMDSLQLAVAIESACTRFVTNDKGLHRITEIEVVTLDQF